MVIDTAALDQPGDEAALMAETIEIGNAEPWSRMPDKSPNAAGCLVTKRAKIDRFSQNHLIKRF